MHPREIAREIPLRTMAVLVAALILLMGLNLLLIRMGVFTNTTTTYPISVFEGPRIIPSGLPFTVLFVASIYLLWRLAPRMNGPAAWGAGLILIVLGNLCQGGFEEGFLHPFVRGDLQYFHDAVQITDPGQWLSSFHRTQSDLRVHTRTHPPFAVLVHYLLMGGLARNVVQLSLSFTVLSSLSVYSFYLLVREATQSPTRAGRLAILYAMVPAVNIYSAACLDGLVAAVAGFALWALVRLQNGKGTWMGSLVYGCCVTLMSLLTFGSVFVFTIGALVALRQIVLHHRFHALAAPALGAALTVAVMLALRAAWGYDHLTALRAATGTEFSMGWFPLVWPWAYLMTRLEGVTEPALLLSLPLLALLLRQDLIRLALLDWRDGLSALTLFAISILAVLLILGVYRAGETARIFLYVYPYLLLGLRETPERTLTVNAFLCGAQTVFMQTFGNYFW